ncbi:MAG: helix-turn-helix transcriptional regulator [Thermoleophilaceae bacterium]|nr:helix-turn-helix transcriptional regulator [Thermoleophilaceae bacterium]
MADSMKKLKVVRTAPSEGEFENIVPSVGPRVHALRDAMGLSLRDLALRTGVSAPMLSQVERGETSPTLAVAAKIANGLDLSLSQLLRLDERQHVMVVTPSERRQGKGRARGHSYQLLTPSLPGQRIELSEHTLRPGAATGGADDPPMHEPGSRETVYLLSGAVSLVIDGQERALETGDTVTFDSDLSHHFVNHSKDQAVFLAVTAAGLRRS